MERMKTHILYYISLSPCSEHVKQQKQHFGDDKSLTKYMVAETIKHVIDPTLFAPCFQLSEKYLAQGHSLE